MKYEDMQNEQNEMKQEPSTTPMEFNQYSIPASARPDRTPAEQKKEKKSSGIKAMAWMCAACVILSGAAGFGGHYLAGRLTDSPAESAEVRIESDTADAPVVIYKSAETVNTAANAAVSSGSDMTYAQVAAMVKDSVVEINTEYKTQNIWFQYTTGGAGSGVILSEDGYIVTNAHVILDNNQQNVADTVTVRLTDGSEYPAEVIAYDTDEDIAIVKIEAKNLKAVKCGDSDKLVVGDELLIVGNPLGELGGTVTNGIVSATEREIQVGGVTMHLIQTNAAVNPGNSGGGMFNMKGELVGVVNAKSSGTGIEGLGFAIPVNKAVAVSEELMTKGYVSGKPMIGVSFEDVSNNSMGGYGFFFGGGSSSSAKPGVYVRSLVEGMNDKVLKEGDRIIAVNGEEISTSDDIKAIVSKSAIGDKLTLQLYRDGKLMEADITVFERTPDVKTAAASSDKDEKPEKNEKKTVTTKPVIGVSLQEMPESGVTKAGVYIAALEEGMNDKVFEVGDRIEAVDGKEITSIDDVKAVVAESKPGDKLNFRVSRDGKLVSLEVTVFEKTVDEEEAVNEAPKADQAPKDEEDAQEYDYNDLFDLFREFMGGR